MAIKPKDLKALGLKRNKKGELVNLPPKPSQCELRFNALEKKIDKILEWIKAKDAEIEKTLIPQKPKLTKEQIDVLDLELLGRPTLGLEIKTHFKIDHLSELPPDQFLNVLKHIKNLIANEKYITPSGPTTD